jgi:hypothetical protein
MLLRIRLYKPAGAERICSVATAPAFNKPGSFLIQVSRGARTGKLQQSAVYGPFPEGELSSRFDEVVQKLKSEGYSETAPNLLLGDLQSKSPKVRARAAQRLGWMKCKQAVAPMLSTTPARSSTPWVRLAIPRPSRPSVRTPSASCSRGAARVWKRCASSRTPPASPRHASAAPSGSRPL